MVSLAVPRDPALATRPGRVELALEIPLPAEGARARLVRLYGQDVPLDEATGAISCRGRMV
jgi:ATP-dependent 26S proteasome regulatory subunit